MRLERGIITYLPLIAALMVIQPSLLPLIRLSGPLPLEKKRGESRFDALSLDDSSVNPNQILRDPRALSVNGRDCAHSWIARMAHPTRTLQHGLNFISVTPQQVASSKLRPPTPVTQRFVHLQLPAIYSRLRDISQDREH